MEKQDITHSYNGENRSQLLADLKAEYERRTHLDIETHEDIEAWLWEMATSDWTAEQVVTYIIQRYDLIDYDTVGNVNLLQKLKDYKDYVEAKIDIDEMPLNFAQWQGFNLSSADL
jgi:uncharacterized protein YktA (UPF0223 family)